MAKVEVLSLAGKMSLCYFLGIKSLHYKLVDTEGFAECVEVGLFEVYLRDVLYGNDRHNLCRFVPMKMAATIAVFFHQS